ncbi:EAL domain-containing protein [Rhizobium sp. CECT 9324]|uniref:putative bifunctional diguanylate cyclase/phosphodiesterase n=1 Tax=Rhizobium sp. CECT 9324 TaxID=2845820 RepID=UPI001E4B9A83|nr:EAL domain-containing protein [Rhizobium sp. CECT 9324]
MLDQPQSKTTTHKRPWTTSGSILLLLAISGLAILGLVFLAAIWAGSESDAAALDRQRQLVNDRLNDQVKRVSQEIQLIGAGYASFLAVDPFAHGEKTLDQNSGDGASSAQTFGKIATTVFGYNAAFLVKPSGELALRADTETARRFKWVRPLLQPLIRDLETTHAQRSSSGAEPTRVELMRLEGRPSVAGVVSISAASRADANAQDHGAQFYLVVFRFLDGATLDMISREQGLAGARYARTSDQEHSEVAFQIAATGSGEPLGFIIWEPDLPGSRVIGRLVPVLSIAGLVIAGLFFALVGRLRKSLRELSASEHHARHLSAHDVLTGLPNRALFPHRLEQSLLDLAPRRKRAVVALIDLDRFKEVNDTYGHAAGDELLRAAADRMNALIKPVDTLARVGGDEFALLLSELDREDDVYLTICNDIIEALSKPFQLDTIDATIRIGCSIGVALFEDTTYPIKEILRRADVALYEAKNSGRGRLVEYDPSLDDRVEARENLKNDLRLLLEGAAEDTGQNGCLLAANVGRLEVYYQGVYRADGSGLLSGAEALVRWHHPTLGLLSPDKFIPIAEETGMILRLGERVLRNAAQAAVSWPVDLSLAVNVSPSQIRHRGFGSDVLSILSETGLPPSRLEIELTEAALFNIDEEGQATLGLLRSHGIGIALDDFGTGFSSLSHLIQFNIDRIKIDRSFVSLLGAKAEGAAIVSAILGLSRTLGKATTAEGVETEGQRDFLVAAGCSDLQGYLLSRPLPLSDFMEKIGAAFQIEPSDAPNAVPREPSALGRLAGD